MKCPLLLAGDYQEGFKQGWVFLGFEDDLINWFQINYYKSLIN